MKDSFFIKKNKRFIFYKKILSPRCLKEGDVVWYRNVFQCRSKISRPSIANFLKTYYTCRKCTQMWPSGIGFGQKLFHERRAIPEKNFFDLAWKIPNYGLPIAWRLRKDHLNLSTVVFSDKFGVKYFHYFMASSFIRKWRLHLLCKIEGSAFWKKMISFYTDEICFLLSGDFFCVYNSLHRSKRMLQRMHSEMIFRDAFLSNTFSWNSYHYWKEVFRCRRKSLQTKTTYYLTAIDSIIKPLSSHILSHLWAEWLLGTIWNHLFV